MRPAVPASVALGRHPLRRFPSDQLDYFRDLMNGDARPTLPVRDRVKGGGGGIVTNTPEAVCRLFSPHEDDKPTNPFEPIHAINPKIYWEPWVRPKRGIAIDDCIERLIISSGQLEETIEKKRSKTKSVDPRHRGPYNVREMTLKDKFSNLSHGNGEFGGHECPYVYARWRLAEAVGLAYDDIDAHEKRKSTIPEIDDALERIKLAKSGLENAITAIDKLGPLHVPIKYKRKSLMGTSFVQLAADRQRRRELGSALDAIVDAEIRFKSHREEISRKGRVEKIWWISFVINCGFIWTALTRVPPDVGQPGFEGFLEAAVTSLGGKRSGFLRPVETAVQYLSEMDPWDQWDAEINGVLPPEMSAVKIYNEDEQRHVFGRFERSVLHDIEKFKNGDDEALQVLGLRYLHADESGKRLIEDLLERHKVASTFKGAVRVNH